MKDKEYNIVYQTKNLINNKTYIGVHSTNDLNDGYIGSGIRLMQAITKYGKNNFACETLNYFDTRTEALNEEQWLVTQEWVNSNSNYNATTGGGGGGHTEITPEYRKMMSEACIGIKKHKDFGKNMSGSLNHMYGKTHSKETRNKISEGHLGRKAHNSIKVFCGSNNKVYNSIIEAAADLGHSTYFIRNLLAGVITSKNKKFNYKLSTV